MNRLLEIFSIFSAGGLLGFLAGMGSMLILFPYIFPPAAVNETIADRVMDAMPVAVASSRFREGTSGQDFAHSGEGGIRVYRSAGGAYYLEMQPDFSVLPGPDFYVYLNSRRDVDDEADFLADTGRQEVARLRSFSGAQVYRLTDEQFRSMKAVTVWCKTFGEYIASANLP
ncbi:MAG: DM13 domain-containing protein [Gammaproteobacteria bacterium]